MWVASFPLQLPYDQSPQSCSRPFLDTWARVLAHCLDSIDIFLQLCQAVIYRASLCSLCHLIWWQWLIYLCSSALPSVWRARYLPAEKSQRSLFPADLPYGEWSSQLYLWSACVSIYFNFCFQLRDPDLSAPAFLLPRSYFPSWNYLQAVNTFGFSPRVNSPQPRCNTEEDHIGFCSLFSNCYWSSDPSLSTLFCWFRRPEEKSMTWDTHERPGISGGWPGLAGFHQSGSSWGSCPDGGSGVEGIQTEHDRSKWPSDFYTV